MFNSAILDVVAGVIFGFLAVSLFTSAAVEAIINQNISIFTFRRHT